MSENPASSTGGVKVFSIQGRLYLERQRLHGMTEEERCLRAQWVRDQRLGRFVRNEALEKELTNPFRRLYRFPLYMLYLGLKPIVGQKTAVLVRTLVRLAIGGAFLTYSGWYYLKYNANDWTRKGGWRVRTNRPALFPGEEGYPDKYDRAEPADYASRGFKESPI